MNDKYIQAIIIGALIGGSIIVAELISQPKRNNMELHTIELQKDIKDIETFDVKDKKIIVKVNAKNKIFQRMILKRLSQKPLRVLMERYELKCQGSLKIRVSYYLIRKDTK